jgi:hypothetical protein
MDFRIGQGGTLIGEDGKPFVVDGKEIKVDIEDQIKDRLERQRAQLTKELSAKDDQIRALKAQTARTPELELMLVDLQSQKRELEQQAQETATKLSEAERSAEQRVASQLGQFKTEAERYKQELESERQARLREQITNVIHGAAKDKFNDVATDVVPHLLQAHKREPELGPDGKPVDGKFKDLFEIRFKKEDGSDASELMPVDKALDIWGQMHPHHVRATGGSGSGGGNYIPGASGMKRSQMNPKDKSDFIDKHGKAAYGKLPL